jgi:hypothetical protein
MHTTPLAWPVALCVAAALLAPACTHANADNANDEPAKGNTSILSRLLSHAPDYHDVIVPSGTHVTVTLNTALASNANAAEDPVSATVSSPVVINGVEAIPAGSTVRGAVTNATPSGKVQGRARLAFRFDQLDIDHVHYNLTTKRLAYQAHATKKADAEKIGGGAALGTLIGAIAGGEKGAAVGAAVGGGVGTAVVLSTPGDEIRLAPGATLTVELEAPVTVRVPSQT